MSKLTETVCIKVSKETKSFLNDLDNSSEFIRRLILRSQKVKSEISSITEFLVQDGDRMISFDEKRLEEIIKETSESIILEIFDQVINK